MSACCTDHNRLEKPGRMPLVCSPRAYCCSGCPTIARIKALTRSPQEIADWKQQNPDKPHWAIHYDPAPAVPVGAQPEPAEYVCIHGKRVTDHYCGDMAENDVAPAPAVPVVHPEPGDRAQQWVEAVIGAEASYHAAPDYVRGMVERSMALADVEVAAAVAAVRADLAGQVLSLRHYGAVGDATFNDGLERAAALIRGRS